MNGTIHYFRDAGQLILELYSSLMTTSTSIGFEIMLKESMIFLFSLFGKYLLSENSFQKLNYISNYIIDNLLEQNLLNDQYYFYNNFSDDIVDSLNFYCFPDDVISLIFIPNKPSQYTPSSDGTLFYFPGLIRFLLTQCQDTKIFL